MEINEKTKTEEVKSWVKNSAMLKLITVTALMLLLMIPSSMIKGIIHERQHLNDSAIREVSSKWAGVQHINGPIITIPLVYEYTYKIEGEDDEEDKIKTTQKTQYLHILPEDLKIEGDINPEKL